MNNNNNNRMPSQSLLLKSIIFVMDFYCDFLKYDYLVKKVIKVQI